MCQAKQLRKVSLKMTASLLARNGPIDRTSIDSTKISLHCRDMPAWELDSKMYVGCCRIVPVITDTDEGHNQQLSVAKNVVSVLHFAVFVKCVSCVVCWVCGPVLFRMAYSSVPCGYQQSHQSVWSVQAAQCDYFVHHLSFAVGPSLRCVHAGASDALPAFHRRRKYLP